MKKTLLSLSLILAGFAASAQCTPDPTVTSGISPDTAQNLSVAYTGQSYSEVLTFVVPTDTVVLGNSVTIAKFVLDGVVGYPTSHFDYTCNPTNCEFDGGTSGCVNLFSTTDPTASEIGSYQLTITTTPYILVFGAPVAQAAVDFDGYYLVVADGASAGLTEIGQGQMKSLIAYPNPTSGATTIEYGMGYNSEVTFTLTNLLGSVINKQTKAAAKGLNSFNVDASDLSEGVYLYTITDGINSISKKLIVNK